MHHGNQNNSVGFFPKDEALGKSLQTGRAERVFIETAQLRLAPDEQLTLTNGVEKLSRQALFSCFIVVDSLHQLGFGNAEVNDPLHGYR